MSNVLPHSQGKVYVIILEIVHTINILGQTKSAQARNRHLSPLIHMPQIVRVCMFQATMHDYTYLWSQLKTEVSEHNSRQM